MITTATCGTCRHWKRIVRLGVPRSRGTCSSDKVIDTYGSPNDYDGPADGVFLEDGLGDTPTLETGEAFCCVHWAASGMALVDAALAAQRWQDEAAERAAAARFRRAWEEVQTGRVRPVSELWEGIEAAEPQPPPRPSDAPPVLSLVQADLNARAVMGLEKYGTLLQPHNGRDALWDAYQEVLDLAMYLRQELAERSAG